MTPQELFTNTLVKIRAQGGPAVLGGAGAYRAPNGRGCAVGANLTDEQAERAGRGSILYSDSARKVATEALGNDLIPLAIKLQFVHDSAASTGIRMTTDEEFFESWEPKMRALATEFGLEYTEPAGA